jgi:hypothetical protein
MRRKQKKATWTGWMAAVACGVVGGVIIRGFLHF